MSHAHQRQRQDASRAPHQSPAAPQVVREKAPPQSIEAEQAVLGGILLKPKAAASVFDALTSADFYLGRHSQIFDAMRSLHDAREPVDLITVSMRLKAAGCLEEIGGRQYLAALAESLVGAANAQRHADIVRDKARLRELIAKSVGMAESAYAEGAVASEIVSAAQSDLSDLARSCVGKAGKLVDARQAVRDFWSSYNARSGQSAGVRTPFAYLNAMGGLVPGETIVIGAQSSNGKTALALSMLAHACAQGAPCAMFSLEMRREKIVQRLLAAESLVDAQRLRTDRLTEDELRDAYEASDRISAWPLHIYDDPFIKPEQFRDMCRTLKADHGIQVAVLDYLQLVEPSRRGNGDTREREVAEVSRMVNGVAKELGVCVVTMSQLNEENRMRESRAIKNDADIVLLIEPWDNTNAANEAEVVDITVDKARDSRTGKFQLSYLKKFVRFADVARGL